MCWSRLREEAAAWLYIITDNSNKLDQTVFLDQNKRLILEYKDNCGGKWKEIKVSVLKYYLLKNVRY